MSRVRILFGATAVALALLSEVASAGGAGAPRFSVGIPSRSEHRSVMRPAPNGSQFGVHGQYPPPVFVTAPPPAVESGPPALVDPSPTETPSALPLPSVIEYPTGWYTLQGDG